MIQENPLLSPNICGLSDVHTLKTPTIPILLRVLASVLPDFIKERRTNPKAKPVKLLVIDALTELFHSNGKTSSQTLTQRSKDLSEIAVHLHSIASQHNIAIIVLNEVVDVFNRDFYNQDPGKPGEVVYRDQSRLFGRADSIPGEDRKEAALGLVWANIVNARIMLSRTDRMRDSSDFDVRPIKRRRVSEQGPSPSHTDDPASESLRVRRLSVIFNQHAPPASLDYIVTKKGVSVVSGVEPPVSAPCPGPRLQAGPSRTTAHVAPLSREHPQLSGELLTLHGAEPEQDVPDVPPAEHEDGAEDGPQDEVDEWDEYWKQVDMKDGDLYNNLDMDALFSSNPG